MNSLPRRLPLAFALAGLAPLFGCDASPKPSVRDLFDSIRVDMHRGDVEARLGVPTLEHALALPPALAEDEAWYLPPPRLEALESPYAPGTIGVCYRNDRVIEKRLNPQWRDG